MSLCSPHALISRRICWQRGHSAISLALAPCSPRWESLGSVATRSRDPPGQGGPVELRCRHSPVWPVLRTGGLGPWFVHARPAWRACLGSYGRDCLARVQHRGQLRSWPLPGGWSEKCWVGSGRRGAPSQGSTGPLAVGDSPLQSGEKTLSGLDGGPRSWGRWLAWACVTPTFWPDGL